MQDLFTSAPTCLRGRRLPGPGEHRQLQDDHVRRLEALDRLRARAEECRVATDPDRDLVTLPEDTLSLLELGDPVWAELGKSIRAWRELVPLRRLEDFGFEAEAENPLEEPNPRMRRFGGGVEAWVFVGEEDGSVYKFYRPLEGPDKKIGSAFGFRRGEEGAAQAEARHGSYRDLFEKFLLIGALGGMPIEVVAATPEGVVVVKQTLGDPLEQGDDVSGRLPEGLIEIPSRFLRADRDHPRLCFCGDRAYLVADLHARNLVRAADGKLRVIDLVGAAWPADGPGADPSITAWLERVRLDPAAGLLAPVRDEDL